MKIRFNPDLATKYAILAYAILRVVREIVLLASLTINYLGICRANEKLRKTISALERQMGLSAT